MLNIPIFSDVAVFEDCSSTYHRDNNTLIIDCVPASSQTIVSVTYSVNGGAPQSGKTTVLHHIQHQYTFPYIFFQGSLPISITGLEVGTHKIDLQLVGSGGNTNLVTLTVTIRATSMWIALFMEWGMTFHFLCRPSTDGDL